MPTMRVSLPGLFANVKDELRHKRKDELSFMLDEVLAHLHELIAGVHTLDEFAEHYCLKDKQP